jgi:hypothetical protein
MMDRSVLFIHIIAVIFLLLLVLLAHKRLYKFCWHILIILNISAIFLRITTIDPVSITC